MEGRCIYIWQLDQVLTAEGGVNKVVEKAVRAKLSALWIKIADGTSPYRNVRGTTGQDLGQLISKCHGKGIAVWGWQVPHVADATTAGEEVEIVGQILEKFPLDGIIMDAEGGPEFFKGDEAAARAYAQAMRQLADRVGKPLALSSNDIPQNIENWLPRFDIIASVADFNAPQVYYGGSSSVLNRLTRAEVGNAHVSLPFIPVGAAWVGDGGGCSSASAAAERGREFIHQIKQRGYEGYSFWHWAGAPMLFWEVLNLVPA